MHVYPSHRKLFLNKLSNFYRRLEDAISQRESEKREKLEKWQEVTERISVINVDTRTKLRNIKEKNPHTTTEIQEQLEAIQVKNLHGTIIERKKHCSILIFLLCFNFFVYFVRWILLFSYFFLFFFLYFAGLGTPYSLRITVEVVLSLLVSLRTSLRSLSFATITRSIDGIGQPFYGSFLLKSSVQSSHL